MIKLPQYFLNKCCLSFLVNGYDECLLGSQVDGFYRYEAFNPEKAKLNEAATKIQSCYRGHRVRQKRPETKNGGKSGVKEDAAAAKIQAGYHGFKVRKELKAQNEAAVKIQAGYQGYNVRKQLRKGEGNAANTNLPSITEEEEAATKIQATYRGHQARRKAQEAKEANEAAVKIQAGYRGFHARKKIPRKNEDEAAIKIQAGYRGYKARKLKRAQSDAAVKIQSYYRGYRTRKDIQRSLTKQSSLLGVSKPSDTTLGQHRDSRFSFSLPEDVKFEGDLDDDSDSDIEKVVDKMEAYQKSVKSMKEIHVNSAEEAKFAAEKFDKAQV